MESVLGICEADSFTLKKSKPDEPFSTFTRHNSVVKKLGSWSRAPSHDITGTMVNPALDEVQRKER